MEKKIVYNIFKASGGCCANLSLNLAIKKDYNTNVLALDAARELETEEDLIVLPVIKNK